MIRQCPQGHLSNAETCPTCGAKTVEVKDIRLPGPNMAVKNRAIYYEDRDNINTNTKNKSEGRSKEKTNGRRIEIVTR